jgi:hypothetical protein
MAATVSRRILLITSMIPPALSVESISLSDAAQSPMTAAAFQRRSRTARGEPSLQDSST